MRWQGILWSRGWIGSSIDPHVALPVTDIPIRTDPVSCPEKLSLFYFTSKVKIFNKLVQKKFFLNNVPSRAARLAELSSLERQTFIFLFSRYFFYVGVIVYP